VAKSVKRSLIGIIFEHLRYRSPQLDTSRQAEINFSKSASKVGSNVFAATTAKFS
jgi:hypothetical protein